MQAMIRIIGRAILATCGLVLLLAPAPALAEHNNTCHPPDLPPIIIVDGMIIIDEPIAVPAPLSLTLQVQPDSTDAGDRVVVHLVHDRGRTTPTPAIVEGPAQGTGRATCAAR
jgi:hypothetical protein